MTQQRRAHIVVLGNAKGGSGKSTVAMHIVGRLLGLGHRVAAVDVDGRQATLGRYVDNRQRFADKYRLDLRIPALETVLPSQQRDPDAAQAEERDRFIGVLERVVSHHDVVVVDCPGNDSFLSRLSHSCADTLVTPLNDSFVDFDVLAHVEEGTDKILQPSWYSEMVWEQRKRRYLADKQEIDWLVLRNRRGHVCSRNERKMKRALDGLSTRIGFRWADGLADRVVYRELFLQGLTLADLRLRPPGLKVTMTHVAAHQELKDLVAALGLTCIAQGCTERPPATDGDTHPLAAVAGSSDGEANHGETGNQPVRCSRTLQGATAALRRCSG